MIKVVNKYRHEVSDNDVYIGRGSPLGNPFTSQPLGKTKANTQCTTREESINNFREYIKEKIKNKDITVCNELNRLYKQALTKDLNLVCFCSPLSCHGDVIKEIIDEKILNIGK